MRSFSRSAWVLVGESIPHDMLKSKCRLKKKKGNAKEKTNSQVIWYLLSSKIVGH